MFINVWPFIIESDSFYQNFIHWHGHPRDESFYHCFYFVHGTFLELYVVQPIHVRFDVIIHSAHSFWRMRATETTRFDVILNLMQSNQSCSKITHIYQFLSLKNNFQQILTRYSSEKSTVNDFVAHIFQLVHFHNCCFFSLAFETFVWLYSVGNQMNTTENVHTKRN